MKCQECNGTGKISLTYADARYSEPGWSVDRAIDMAGAHYKWAPCQECDGHGQMSKTWESVALYLDEYPPLELHIRCGLSFLTARDGKQYTSVANDTLTVLEDLVFQAMEDDQ